IEEIRQTIISGNYLPDLNNPVVSGKISNENSVEVDYKIFVGWDFLKASQCDQLWGGFNIDLIQFIHDQKYDPTTLAQIESYIQLGDSHWDWLKKSIAYQEDEYKWFFLYAQDKPQAVCLIYHPKASVLTGNNIFYIEYIAVAPWNRKNPMNKREFSSLGMLLIKFVTNYAAIKLNLTLGFSLHSLPSAIPFYQHIGMQYIDGKEKDGLKFFEMPCDVANKYMEAS
ncbi:hypothetical protein ACNAUY_13750, partial [Acinetobacter tibetensis]|uniref:hypothetical protein n=1 Tax=Acinetobacter tibetensis TaxID=2943497 RepID=UPI003A4D1D76